MRDSILLTTPYQLMNAISSSSLAELNEFIELGGNVNMECQFQITPISEMQTKFLPRLDCLVHNVPSLHQAVRVCYDRASNDPRNDDAIAVLELLLENGADPTVKIDKCKVCNIVGIYENIKIFLGGTPLMFADYLGQYNVNSQPHRIMMHKVTKLQSSFLLVV